MNGEQATLHKRVDITLPKDTVRLIDRVAKKGDRSRLIDEAVRHYLEVVGMDNLRNKLKAGAMMRAERDLMLTGEWFLLDEETWPKNRR